VGGRCESGASAVTQGYHDLQHLRPAGEGLLVNALVRVDRCDEFHEVARHLVGPDGIAVLLVSRLCGFSRALAGLGGRFFLGDPLRLLFYFALGLCLDRRCLLRGGGHDSRGMGKPVILTPDRIIQMQLCNGTRRNKP